MIRRAALLLFLLISSILIASQQPDSVSAQDAAVWQAEYFPGLRFQGEAVRETIAGTQLKRYFGRGRPHALISADFFSARFTHKLTTNATSRQRIVSVGDDGYKIFVDGRLIVDQNSGVPMQKQINEFNLPAGQHIIYVEYYEMIGNAAIDVQMYEIGRSQVTAPAPPATPQPAAPTPAAPTPLPPSPPIPAGDAIIELFEITPNPAPERSEVTVRWRVRNASNVLITNFVARSRFEEPVIVFVGSPLEGSVTYTLPSDSGQGGTRFTLDVTGLDGGSSASASRGLEYGCRFEWFFSGADDIGCPSEAAEAVTLQQQRFEKGVVIDPMPQFGFSVAAFESRFGGMQMRVIDLDGNTPLDPSLVPPAGLHVPQGRLGEAWRRDADLRAELGWALTAQPDSLETFSQGQSSGDTFLLYFGAEQGGIWLHEQRSFTLSRFR